MIVIAFAVIGAAAVFEGGGITWVELDRLVEVLDGAIVLNFARDISRLRCSTGSTPSCGLRLGALAVTPPAMPVLWTCDRAR